MVTRRMHFAVPTSEPPQLDSSISAAVALTRANIWISLEWRLAGFQLAILGYWALSKRDGYNNLDGK